MNRLFLILLFFISIDILSQQKLEFVGERIDFTIDSEIFSVNGIYYFYNNSEKEIRQRILFPFSKNTDFVAVKRVYNLTYFKNINFHRFKDAITFYVNILPKDTIKVNIAYSQNTVKENIYILKSTQVWGKALTRADYSLSVDNSVQIDSLSLKPDSLCKNIYYWRKKDFYPNENFKVWVK